jgi:hypothetical protein
MQGKSPGCLLSGIGNLSAAPMRFAGSAFVEHQHGCGLTQQ